MYLDFLAHLLRSLDSSFHSIFKWVVYFNRWSQVTSPPPSAVLESPIPNATPGSSFTSADTTFTEPDIFLSGAKHAFSLDLPDIGTAKEQILSGLLGSLGLDEWISLQGTLGAASDLPEISLTPLVPLVITILSVLVLWFVLQELLPAVDDVGQQALDVSAKDVPFQRNRSLTHLAFGNIEDLNSGLHTTPLLEDATAAQTSSNALDTSNSVLAIEPEDPAPNIGDDAMDLAPMVFTDPTTLPADDLDSPFEVSLRPPISKNSDRCPSVPPSTAKDDLGRISLRTPTATNIQSVPSAAPSFDVLEPLAAASSDLATQLMDENLEESLSDEVLQSAGLITPADSVAEVVVDVSMVSLGPSGDPPPPVLAHGVGAFSTAVSNDEDAGPSLANGTSTSGGPTICARLPIIELEDDTLDIGDDPLHLSRVCPAVTADHAAKDDSCASNDQQPACDEVTVRIPLTAGPTDGAPTKLAKATADPHVALSTSSASKVTQESTTAPTDPIEEISDYMPSDWSLVTPKSDLSDLIDEPMTAQDWTTVKCYMGFQDDQVNESEQKQMTFIHDYRLSIHFPDPSPAAPLNAFERMPNADDLFCSSPNARTRSLFRNERRRALSEPPLFSDREWIRSEVDPTPKLSATRARLDIFKDPRCPVVPAEADKRFPLTSPELQGCFPSIAARMGFITHNRSHLRFIPRAEMDYVLEGERAALKLATAHELRRRHSIGGFHLSKYGLTKTAFLRAYVPYIKDQMSYAEVTGTGIEPWGRVITANPEDKCSPTGNRLNLPKFLEVNRNRSGPDVNVNGVDFKAEYTRPVPPLRRDPNHPSAGTSSRPKTSIDEQTSTPSTPRNRKARHSLPRFPSFATVVQNELRRSNSFQSNAHSTSPDGSDHKRARSASPFTSAPGRQKRTRFAEPPVQGDGPSTASPSHSPGVARQQSILARRCSASPLQRLSTVGRPRNLETVVGSPTKAESTTAVTVVHSSIASAPSLDAMAAIVRDEGCGTWQPKAGTGSSSASTQAAKACARIDDDGVLEKFESELVAGGSSGQ
ncbi:uncharacterized protein PHACADRAFT_30669 [Phanerochaete carnosa HHB-10118-sp]|uniref:Uncharacterized protein n=1 Tax=Phanerochaete carnosa (strain HHB-10118-sp) TaxID=650164 RepID=K5VQH4_PHACS|nr:uncharacterized protein PHACADRAFT_30669 [Phanerochaete carnosa HHB-10118-sp]EKM53728.1 hypothetical protein PHACADRAFT_30669 [Phanerochaete carnosa HHB-10118-sp]